MPQLKLLTLGSIRLLESVTPPVKWKSWPPLPSSACSVSTTRSSICSFFLSMVMSSLADLGRVGLRVEALDGARAHVLVAEVERLLPPDDAAALHFRRLLGRHRQVLDPLALLVHDRVLLTDLGRVGLGVEALDGARAHVLVGEVEHLVLHDDAAALHLRRLLGRHRQGAG